MFLRGRFDDLFLDTAFDINYKLCNRNELGIRKEILKNGNGLEERKCSLDLSFKTIFELEIFFFSLL